MMMPGVEESEMAEEVVALCRENFRDCCGREGEREEVDEVVVAERMREMDSWWCESEGACVFGCVRVERCNCFEVLWGN